MQKRVYWTVCIPGKWILQHKCRNVEDLYIHKRASTVLNIQLTALFTYFTKTMTTTLHNRNQALLLNVTLWCHEKEVFACHHAMEKVLIVQNLETNVSRTTAYTERSNLTIAAKRFPEVLQLLLETEDMSDGHFRCIKISKYRITLTKNEFCKARSVPCSNRSAISHLSLSERNVKIREDVIKPATNE